MDEEGTWAHLFFSGSRPDLLKNKEFNGEEKFRPFCAETEDWKLGELVDKSRPTDASNIEVFWIRINGRRKYVGKVFPDYTEEQATMQLHRLGVSSLRIPEVIDDAVREFDKFFREARAYNHLDLFCCRRERIYFPQFFGVVTDMSRSRFSSGYVHQRAVILEAIKPGLCSRRILGEDAYQLPESFSSILEKLPLSSFEREWYYSLLKDRLRRLDALHRIGLTHGDINDCHFRLPDDIYDTVLYDFSESYTFSEKLPFRVNSGRPRPLRRISQGERERVSVQIRQRAASRDLRSHLIRAGSETSVDNALCQSLDEEKELLELIILKACSRPDYFSMPTLNSVFPFLEKVCSKSDPCWHIRRGRLLHYYEPFWAVSHNEENRPASITFDGEIQFEMMEMDDKSHFILCLVPKSWIVSLKANHNSSWGNTGLFDKLRQVCTLLLSTESPGYVIGRGEFLAACERQSIQKKITA
ncbi:hypothetical protein BO71DRAFT_325301 [Aspergillus ellipticus CBS 707.79]|uniref:Protein kinase domain-containing protein n=1 Tax=Aspergillus ellipticus CBS 707.79 TaxID=1448320 RepID=A0A319DK19_9EURO|nr:hypothetical protein BO71DRAFT_325301 [Aspergillus ellipticus CBS 707.79]